MISDEGFALWMIRLNKRLPKKELRREWRGGGWRVWLLWRSSKNLWGRFGGGWNWKLGFSAGGRTAIFDLLVFSLGVSRERTP